MTKQTTTTLAIAFVYFAVFLGVLIYAFISVQAQQVSYSELSTTLATQTAKRSVAKQITELSSTTIEERAELKKYFVTEKKTISFITEIESIARGMGISLETIGLDMVPATDKTTALLKTTFSVTGSQDAVMTFMAMMESLPYHSRVPSMDLLDKGGNTWQGLVSVEVTIAS